MNAQTMIDRARDLLGDTALTFYSRQFMYDVLKLIVAEIAERSRVLQKTEFRATTSTITSYSLPSDFIEMVAVRYDPGGGFEHLRRGNRAFFYTNTAGTTERWDFDQKARIFRDSGTVTGGSATQLVRAGYDFTALTGDNALRVGDLVLNVTDDSEASVSQANNGSVDLKVPGLEGGSDNVFASGDSYEIHSYDRPLHSIEIWPAPRTSATGEEPLEVTYISRHFDLDTVTSDLSITPSSDNLAFELELDEEFRNTVIEMLVSWCMRRRRRNVPDNAILTQEARAERMYLRALRIVKSRIDEVHQSWASDESWINTRKTITVNGVIPTG